MRRLCLLFAVVAFAGCGRSPESQVVGTWKVDPSTITISRLLPGADKRPDWTDATTTMGSLTLTFTKSSGVTATGMDQTSTGTWRMYGDTIQISGAGDHWPQMTLDPRTPTIHVTMEQDGDQMRLDLVKSK